MFYFVLFCFVWFSILVYSSHGVICINIKLKTESFYSILLFWFASWIKINGYEWVHNMSRVLAENIWIETHFAAYVCSKTMFTDILCYYFIFVLLYSFIRFEKDAAASLSIDVHSLSICATTALVTTVFSKLCLFSYGVEDQKPFQRWNQLIE